MGGRGVVAQKGVLEASSDFLLKVSFLICWAGLQQWYG